VFTAAPHSPKIRNLAAEPRVSIGIFAPLVGQASSRGAQLFGRTRILDTAHSEHAFYWAAVRWQSDHVERSGFSASHHPRHSESSPLIASSIPEHWLRRDGYAPRQFWRPESEPTIEGAIPV
jgi:hypothetical protein